MIKPDLSLPLPADLGAVHFVGIGGSGMSGIARLFLAADHTVSGSDRTENHNTEQLRELGATVSIGHSASNPGLAQADALVYTGALWPDNPEYLAAVERGIPVLHRSQALAWLINRARLVAVAGAHGKTTSTGMIITALLELGADPSFVNGGVIQSLGVSSAFGSGELFVVEADESDGSFLLYDTAVALITNVDADHLDHYGDHDAFDAAFVTFANRASELVVISSDDAGARRVTTRLEHKRVVTFGEDESADVRVSNISTSGPVAFSVTYEGVQYNATLRVPGRHNAINAAGAFAVLVGLGFDPKASLAGIGSFGGTERRFELHGTVRGVSVYDDYAHHPTEVAAALSGARSVLGEGRLIAIHQPHLYSRTQAMAGEFAETYEALADHTIVLDVYGAREDPVPGVTGALVSERFADPSRVDYLPDWDDAARRAAAIARPGDLIMTLSCGDVYRIVPQVLDALEAPLES
ncbi:UDP-N-acetylmuramate--alanine ligase [Microbacteriaceae bacterium SG_E_30_P1]|uniref:UDP-N-acetylmuramate--L-alanine ligase n=1 Tax=Antiquaquibacter oligotrophicus TaxID=2880260 RepID=A0ABT6KM46_9MICO|nr:UDP-N-acetylmuramate--L-alanine ligase [Antiquaquibacter oligotrophicus]MDH6180821.1 UDP-N-acetylmuramate--alanine ligase [Antiquaquibacter oligotrophicus]UDF13463.1 UDP-N-acetylmuramate--L-alanine ligase [Antiquaquibacter oligotrophicus]